MPAPTKDLITGLAMSTFPSGPNPQTAPKLAGAFGSVVGFACGAFVDRVQMAPGVPCAVSPPPAPPTGTVAGIGTLIGAPPSEMEVKLEAERAAKEAGMSAADQARFTDILTKMTAKGLTRIRELATVLPGTPVAGGITVGPARIQMSVGVVKAELEVMARTMNPPKAPKPQGGWTSAQPQSHRLPNMPVMGGHRAPGITPPSGPPQVSLPEDFADIAAKLLVKTFEQMETQVMVAPGIQVAGMVTVTAGRLV